MSACHVLICPTCACARTRVSEIFSFTRETVAGHRNHAGAIWAHSMCTCISDSASSGGEGEVRVCGWCPDDRSLRNGLLPLRPLFADVSGMERRALLCFLTAVTPLKHGLSLLNRQTSSCGKVAVGCRSSRSVPSRQSTIMSKKKIAIRFFYVGLVDIQNSYVCVVDATDYYFLLLSTN